MPIIPALWEANAGGSLKVRNVPQILKVQDQPGQHGASLTLLKIQKISWAWWHMPVIPATREPETGESLEPGRQRL